MLPEQSEKVIAEITSKVGEDIDESDAHGRG
jgi:hypothetical protein